MAVNLNGNYTLGANINTTPELTSGMWRTAGNPNASGDYGFVTIGTSNFSDHFTGALDGQGYTISNLTINATTTSNQGLFAYLSSGSKVSNLALTNETVVGLDNVGGLAGQGDGTITNVSTGGTIGVSDPTKTVGGLLGFNKGTISGSSSSVSLGSAGAAGGLVGINDGPGQILNSSASGTIISSSYAPALGGLVGNNYGSISGSFATGNVTGGDYASVGGLVGSNFPNASITNSYASGAVTISAAIGTNLGGNVGGLVGSNYGGSISLSHSVGPVINNGDGGPYTGGLVGYNGSIFGSAGGSIDSSYATGSVSSSGNGGAGGLTGSQPFAGGLVGYNDATAIVTKSYASSTVSVTGPNAEGGGLAGYNNGSISDAYARGSVSGSTGSIIGGFVGYNDSSGSITRTYAANVVAGASGRPGDPAAALSVRTLPAATSRIPSGTAA